MKIGHPMCIPTLVLAGVLALDGVSAQAAGETAQSMLAAQIRLQGFVCEKPLGATRDAKRSKADHAVWVLKCSNANYRVSRAPDMAARFNRFSKRLDNVLRRLLPSGREMRIALHDKDLRV